MSLWKGPFILSTFLAVLWLMPLQAMASDLPVDHWAYDYLDRLKVKGLLDDFLNQTRPISREEVARAIWQTNEAGEAGDSRLSEVERSQLEWLLMEFAEELQDYSLSVEGEERHLFSWSDQQRGLILDMVGEVWSYLGHSANTDRRILDARVTLQARGFLGDELTYGASFVKGQVRSNLKRVTKDDVGLTGYFSSQGHYAYYDWSHAHVSLRFPWFQLQIGRQPISWGPGIRGNLVISQHAPAYDFFQIRASVRRVKFIHMHGFLLSDVKTERHTPEGFIRTEYANKFIAAHRLEIGFLSWATLGLSEAVIYGERGLDLAYSNPLVFFWSAQHSSHDRDNEILGADLRVRPIPGLDLYGALFIDEIYLKKLFAQDARNRVAFQGGIYLVDPLGLEDTDLRLEYARVQPCVYTHKFPVNTYRHDGVSLGHWLEENGDDLYLAARHRFSRQLRITTYLARTRQGERGEQPWCHLESWRYPFLWGIVDRTLTVGVGLEAELIHQLRASLHYERRERDNKDHLAGEDETLNELSLALSFEY
jgi:hypothetical protein